MHLPIKSGVYVFFGYGSQEEVPPSRAIQDIISQIQPLLGRNVFPSGRHRDNYIRGALHTPTVPTAGRGGGVKENFSL